MANFFPRWTNWIPIKMVVCVIVLAGGLTGGHLVLRHAEIYKGRIPADPAGAISARYSRNAIGNGLPVLPQLRRSGRAIERAQHCDVHELPHAGGER